MRVTRSIINGDPLSSDPRQVVKTFEELLDGSEM
jgi:hypothetical protein